MDRIQKYLRRYVCHDGALGKVGTDPHPVAHLAAILSPTQGVLPLVFFPIFLSELGQQCVSLSSIKAPCLVQSHSFFLAPFFPLAASFPVP